MADPVFGSGMAAVMAPSGDIAIDRRYQWAQASSEAQDFAAARDILEQVTADAPHWPPGWRALADACLDLDDRPAAIAALCRLQALDPAGLFGARLKLAALGATPPPASADAAYVAGLFDQYAERFDEHLTQSLDYRGPAILMDAIRRACARAGRETRFDVAYDLGCGTGLMARELSTSAGVIHGVDLSARMIEAAALTGHYHDLKQGDVAAYLDQQAAECGDLAAAADVFVYIGDLAPVLAAARRALARNGLLAFTLQRQIGQDDGQENAQAPFLVGPDMRFAHAPHYLRDLAAAHGFEILLLEEVSVRKDRGEPVAGLAAVLRKP